MSSEQEVIQEQMDKTKSSLAQKLDALEGQVASTVTSTTEAVQGATQTATGAVETVKETVDNVTEKVQEAMTSVTDKVQETVQAISDTFNLRLQMEQHPWMVLGGALGVGCLIGATLGSGQSDSSEPHETAQSSRPVAPQAASFSAQPAQEKEGPFEGVVTRLKELGISYVMGLVRDLAKRELPESFGSRVAEEMDAFTSKLGAQPIKGEVMEAAKPNVQEKFDYGNGARNRMGMTR